MPSVQGPSPDTEQAVALQAGLSLEPRERSRVSACKQKRCYQLGTICISQMRMTQIARAVTTAGKISSGGRSEPQVHPFLLTVLVSEAPWQFVKASQQWLVAGAAAFPCVTVSF